MLHVHWLKKYVKMSFLPYSIASIQSQSKSGGFADNWQNDSTVDIKKAKAPA